METLGIEQRIRDTVAKTIKVFPVHTNRASELGHDCLRYLVYLRTENDKRLLHDATLELIFREGKLHEPFIVRQLEDTGLEVIEQQRAFQDKEDLNITGHIDGKIILDGKAWPMEVKTMSPHIFDMVLGMDDVLAEMRYAKQPWLRKYPAQITCYMALDGKREAVFILKHKVTGRIVDRVVRVDDEYWKSLKMRAEAVNFHLQSQTMPGQIDDQRMCTECGFRHLCLPDVDFGDEADFVAELEDLLERKAELTRQKNACAWLQELSAVEAEIKSMVKGRNKIIAGRWRGHASKVNVKESLHKAYAYDRWSWKRADDLS